LITLIIFDWVSRKARLNSCKIVTTMKTDLHRQCLLIR